MWVLVAQLCLTLCHLTDYSPPGYSVHGIIQARILEWVAVPFSRGYSQPKIKHMSPALQADSLPSEPPVFVVQLLSCVWLFVTPWTAAHQASLSLTISQSLLKLISIELVITSNHLILCCPLFLLPSIFPRIRVFFNELALCICWPKYWSFSFNSSPSNEYSRLISFWSTGLISLLSRDSQESSPVPQFKSINSLVKLV